MSGGNQDALTLLYVGEFKVYAKISSAWEKSLCLTSLNLTQLSGSYLLPLNLSLRTESFLIYSTPMPTIA